MTTLSNNKLLCLKHVGHDKTRQGVCLVGILLEYECCCNARWLAKHKESPPSLSLLVLASIPPTTDRATIATSARPMKERKIELQTERTQTGRRERERETAAGLPDRSNLEEKTAVPKNANASLVLVDVTSSLGTHPSITLIFWKRWDCEGCMCPTNVAPNDPDWQRRRHFSRPAGFLFFPVLPGSSSLVGVLALALALLLLLVLLLLLCARVLQKQSLPLSLSLSLFLFASLISSAAAAWSSQGFFSSSPLRHAVCTLVTSSSPLSFPRSLPVPVPAAPRKVWAGEGEGEGDDITIHAGRGGEEQGRARQHPLKSVWCGVV